MVKRRRMSILKQNFFKSESNSKPSKFEPNDEETLAIFHD